MKSVFLFLSVCLLLLVSQTSIAQVAADYYLPLRVGNYLEFYRQGSQPGWDTRTTRFVIEGSDVIGGQVYFRQRGMEWPSDKVSNIDVFHLFWIRKDIAGNVMLGAMSSGPNSSGYWSTNPDSATKIEPAGPYFTNQSIVPGFSTRYSMEGYSSVDTTMSNTETVQVPAGTFTNCIKIRETKRLISTGALVFTEYRYYARGIGIVKMARDGEPADVLVRCSELTSVVEQNRGSMFFHGTSRARVLDASPANAQAIPSAYQIAGDSISMEAWVFPLDIPGPGTGRVILARPCDAGTGVDPYTTFRVEIRGTDKWSSFPALAVGITDGIHATGSGYETLVRDTSQVKVGQWTHVACTYDRKTVKLYINGQLVRQLPFTAKIGTGSTGIYVGGVTYDYFNGLIGDVRLWKKIRSSSDIGAAWNTRLVGNEQGLVGYWPLDTMYTSGANIVTPDLTMNKNDLIVQYGVAKLSFPPGSPVTIPPTHLGANTYAVSAVPYKSGTVLSWPRATISFVSSPSGMSALADTIMWTPSATTYGWVTAIYNATNSGGTLRDTAAIWVEGMRNAQNQISLDVANRGKLGALGLYGKGMYYKGKNGLYAGDFSLVDRKNNKYAGGLYSSQYSFAPLEGFSDVSSKVSGFSAFRTSFNDTFESNRIGLRITQTTHVKASSPDNRYVILEYTVRNESGAALTDLFAQMSADFDIGISNNNLAGFDSTLGLSYGYEQGGASNTAYYGFALLSRRASGHYAANTATDNTFIRSLTSLTTFAAIPTVPGDIRSQISVGPLSIAANDSQKVAFAFLAGDNLDSLKAVARAARTTYGLLSSVDERNGLANENYVPTTYTLEQNYPNPFNPSTLISYSLPKSANVSLKVFNALGQEVAGLVNERKDAGNYQTTWNATNMPSGIYFYRLQAGEYTETKKMILLR